MTHWLILPLLGTVACVDYVWRAERLTVLDEPDAALHREYDR